MAEAYGYALAWLEQHNLLDSGQAPELRWSRECIDAYASELLRGVRPATVKHRLLSLERALAVLAPNSDRSTLKSIVRSLHVPRDDGRKRNRLQDPDRLVTLGLELMRQAEQSQHRSVRKNAALFRDGLQIALLALRGLRKGNFTSIRIGTHLLEQRGEYWLSFKGEETKNHRPIEIPFPEMLLAHLNRYLENYRPLLAGRRYTGDRLWVSYLYRPQAAHSLQLRLVHHTGRAFGKPINPHLFRDCIATSIAIHDPKRVRMAATILGHGSFATTERHYNLARTIDASRCYTDVISSLRKKGGERQRSRSP